MGDNRRVDCHTKLDLESCQRNSPISWWKTYGFSNILWKTGLNQLEQDDEYDELWLITPSGCDSIPGTWNNAKTYSDHTKTMAPCQVFHNHTVHMRTEQWNSHDRHCQYEMLTPTHPSYVLISFTLLFVLILTHSSSYFNDRKKQ